MGKIYDQLSIGERVVIQIRLEMGGIVKWWLQRRCLGCRFQ